MVIKPERKSIMNHPKGYDPAGKHPAERDEAGEILRKR
jgi:hypothetical protein